MKTKIVLTTLALSLSVLSFAQEKSNLENRITNYSMKIDSIVNSEKIKMNAELNDVEKKAKEGTISSYKYEDEKKRISTKYEEIINEKINAEKEELDEITKTSAMNSVMGKNDESGNNSFSIPGRKRKDVNPKELLNNTGFVYSGGFLNLTDKEKFVDFANNSLDFKFGKSFSSNFAIKHERQIGSFTSPVFVNFGLGIRTDTYHVKGDQVFTQNNDRIQLSQFVGGNLKYSYLRNDYIEIPVEFNFVLNPKYIEYEGKKYLDATRSQLRVGVGAYGGIKIGNRIRYKYSDAVSSKNIFIQKVENGVNPFIFGTKISVGYAGFNLFIKKDLTPIFNNEAALNEKHAVQIGLEFVSFNF